MQDKFNELVKTDLPRFWDTQENKMLYPELREGFIVYIVPNLPKNKIIPEMLLDSRFIRMKPTGLPDKHGKLIYEGDIVIQSVFIDRGDDFYLDMEQTGVVFIRSSQGPMLKKVKTYSTEDPYEEKQYSARQIKYLKLKSSRAEIIGNKFEHPELLEGGE